MDNILICNKCKEARPYYPKGLRKTIYLCEKCSLERANIIKTMDMKEGNKYFEMFFKEKISKEDILKERTQLLKEEKEKECLK